MDGWLQTQRALQVDAFETDPTTLEGSARAAYVRWNALAAQNEIHELLDEFRWKPWATRQGELVNDRQHVIREAVDVLHFIGNILLTVGATDEELAAEYGIKVGVNAARQAQEGGYSGDGSAPVAPPAQPQPQTMPPTAPPAEAFQGAQQPLPLPQPPQGPAPVPQAPPSQVAPQPPQPQVAQPPAPAEPQPAAPAAEAAPETGGVPDVSAYDTPGKVPDEMVVPCTTVEEIQSVFAGNGAASVNVNTGDETSDKKNREMLYKAAKALGGKASVRQRKEQGVVVGIMKPTEDTPAPQAEQPAAPATPAPATEPAEQKDHPLEGKTHVDREGQGWRYVHANGGWNRAPELDTAGQPQAPAPTF